MLKSGPAVIATRPAIAPFNAIDRSIFLYNSCDKIIAATTPPHAAIFVFTTTIDIAEASAALPSAS